MSQKFQASFCSGWWSDRNHGIAPLLSQEIQFLVEISFAHHPSHCGEDILRLIGLGDIVVSPSLIASTAFRARLRAETMMTSTSSSCSLILRRFPIHPSLAYWHPKGWGLQESFEGFLTLPATSALRTHNCPPEWPQETAGPGSSSTTRMWGLNSTRFTIRDMVLPSRHFSWLLCKHLFP